MTVLLARFPLGRYHATPWEAHVNEGRVEFPPSNWRLLRALYATWQERVPDLPEDVVHDLLRALAVPPSYIVPPHRVAHTRHYYPDATSREGARSTDRTLDAFAAVDPDAVLAVIWPVDLPPEQDKALSRLAEDLPYLGRADSICQAEVADNWDTPPGSVRWDPIVEEDAGGETSEDPPRIVARLLTPDLRHDLPLDLDALIERPVELRGARKLRFPRASRFVAYREAGPAPATVKPLVARRKAQEGTVARFVLTDRVRPRLTDTLRLMESFHRAVGSRLGGARDDDRRADSLLLGVDAQAEPLRGDHAHAHFLPVPGPSGGIEEVVVWSPSTLAADEIEALVGLTWVPPVDRERGGGDRAGGTGASERLAVRLSGLGDPRLLPDEFVAEGGGQRVWESLTPYVATGHPHRDREAFLAKRFSKDATQAWGALPAIEDVEFLPLDARGTPAAGFQRRRSERLQKKAKPPTPIQATSPPPMPATAFVRVTFTEPVTGPVSIGALTHFGLGLFRPAGE